MAGKILIMHGPNLNLLGEREPGIYGDTNFETLNAHLVKLASELGLEAEIYQSNHEGDLVDRLHASRKECIGVVLNAGAYTHYSYAIADAIKAIRIPVIEVHISNIYSREEFRRHSLLSPVCKAVVCGMGLKGYQYAVDALLQDDGLHRTELREPPLYC